MNLLLLPPMVLTAAPHPLWTGRRHYARQFDLTNSFDCPHCLVFYGESCINPAGKPIASHTRRLRLVENAWSTERFVVKMTKDVGQLCAKDEMVARYDHDSSSIQLIYRLHDGLPSNQLVSRADASFMCWEHNLIKLG